MKKVLAVLMAVLMTFGVFTVGAAAEDSATGTVYDIGAGAVPRIKATTPGEVIILQAGDVIRFGAITAKTQRLEIRYYPDAASLAKNELQNEDWKTNKVPQYSLDPTLWELDAEKKQTVSDLMAKSPNYYKSFYNYAEFVKGDCPEITVTGMNAEAIFTRDAYGIDRGEAPIDFALENATFVGWALSVYSWKNSKESATIDVYALWDRGRAPEPTDPNPDNPDKPEVEYDTPIQKALAKLLGYVNTAAEAVKTLPAGISMLLPNWLNDLIRGWLYKLFGIEA